MKKREALVATKNQIAPTLGAPDVIAIPPTTFYKQTCLKDALRDRVGVEAFTVRTLAKWRELPIILIRIIRIILIVIIGRLFYTVFTLV
ncbi:hypothetical protein GX865_05260 [Candidatus Saccharibacteria bacterium]|jgi:hypothetical protein|nr:hypothetical protein [Candidatus Saccharibacteria bacterium]